MAIGREGSERGGVIDPVDVRGAGPMEWAQMVGIAPDHALVAGGTEMGPYSISDRWSRVVTRPSSQAGPAGDTIATPDGVAGGIGHWRDVFNIRGSAVPWLLLFLIAIVYLSHLRLSASGSAGGFGKHVRAGAALG